jgi:hypothetical protein
MLGQLRQESRGVAAESTKFRKYQIIPLTSNDVTIKKVVAESHSNLYVLQDEQHSNNT